MEKVLCMIEYSFLGLLNQFFLQVMQKAIVALTNPSFNATSAKSRNRLVSRAESYATSFSGVQRRTHGSLSGLLLQGQYAVLGSAPWALPDGGGGESECLMCWDANDRRQAVAVHYTNHRYR